MENRKRILIATDIYFLHLMRGNHNRIRSYCECLKKYHNVDIFFFKDSGDVADNIYYYKDFLPENKNAVTILQPYNISSQVKYEYKLAFDNFIENNKEYDYVIIPYIWLSYLLDTKPKTKAKFIIDTHDSFSERTKSLKDNGYKFTSACSFEDEKFCLRNFDYIMAISDKEKEIFESMGYSNVFTSKYFYKPKKNKIKLGFIGGNSVHNIDAIKWFYDNVFKDNLSDYLLYICGDIAKHEDIQKLKGLDNIILYEYIWNIEDFYNMIDICINPVQMGSGLKIKNIEALSFNTPIITTSIGIQGMKEEYDNMLVSVADTAEEWIEEVNMLSNEDNILKTKSKIKKYNLLNSDTKVYKDLLDIINFCNK